MKKRSILPAWGRILRGHRPFLSVEITRECPLHCPGCYAYTPDHLAEDSPDLKGQALVDGVLELVRRHRPLHVSLVGGEPLVRFRELETLIPALDELGIETQLVTSAVRPIDPAWADLPSFHLVVSVDGLQPEHDVRRSPATYERILKNIAGHHLIIHCTVTAQLPENAGYLREFASFWSQRPEVTRIWFSLFTPQVGERSAERLDHRKREGVIRTLAELRADYPKVYLPDVVLAGYKRPPQAPEQCLFALVTKCFSSDLSTQVTPCQLGGNPDCSECGCIASAGLASIGSFKLGGLVPVFSIFDLSRRLGERLSRG